MIVFAGIVPCSPLLLPSVNPEHVAEADKTRTSLAEMAEELFATHPDTIVVFCEHTQSPANAFALNVADPYTAKLTAFGDLGYTKTYHPDFMLADRAQRELRKLNEPATLITESDLPFTATVALEFLTTHLPNVRILPIAPCALTPKEHFDFGASLRDILVASDKRIAVIAAGDCSHTRSAEAPGGMHADGQKLDELLATLIEQKNTAGLLQVPPELLQNAQDACYRQIVMLFGTLDATLVRTRLLASEAPFGVGEITAEMVLN
ncbi:MAG: class III extradiol dioxygenase subunit B-like domain-containing protein [Patescibacteria group bacterium]